MMFGKVALFSLRKFPEKADQRGLSVKGTPYIQRDVSYGGI